MLDLHQAIDSALKTNQFAQGGLVLMVVGGVLATCRKIPGKLWQWVKNRLLFTVEIDNSEQSFHWMQAWLASKGKGRFVQARARFDDDTVGQVRPNGSKRNLPHFDLSPRSFCTFRYNGRRVMAWLTKEPVANTTEFRQIITLQFLAIRSCRQLANAMLAEAYEYVTGRTGATVDVWSANGYGDWSLVDRRPVRPVDSLILPDGVRESVFADAKRFFAEKDWYQKMGIPWRRGYLLHGPAGSGKSTLAHVLAGELGQSLYTINLTSCADGGLQSALSSVPAGAVVLIEDIDSAYNNRDTSKDGKVSFGGLLNALDGVAAKEGRILIMTTNHRDKLDPALIRPGRADVHVLMDDATECQAAQLFTRFFPDAAKMAGEFGRRWRGRSMASIQEWLVKHRSDPQAACAALPVATEPDTVAA